MMWLAAVGIVLGVVLVLCAFVWLVEKHPEWVVAMIVVAILGCVTLVVHDALLGK